MNNKQKWKRQSKIMGKGIKTDRIIVIDIRMFLFSHENGIHNTYDLDFSLGFRHIYTWICIRCLIALYWLLTVDCCCDFNVCHTCKRFTNNIYEIISLATAEKIQQICTLHSKLCMWLVVTIFCSLVCACAYLACSFCGWRCTFFAYFVWMHCIFFLCDFSLSYLLVSAHDE